MYQNYEDDQNSFATSRRSNAAGSPEEEPKV